MYFIAHIEKQTGEASLSPHTHFCIRLLPVRKFFLAYSRLYPFCGVSFHMVAGPSLLVAALTAHTRRSHPKDCQ